MKIVDLSGRKVVAARDVESAGKNGATEVTVQEGAVITPSAREALSRYGIAVRGNGNGSGATASAGASAAVVPTGGTYGSGTGTALVASSGAIERLWRSPEAQSIKEEICAVGKKLWLRQYVDGNGGNISFRIGPNEVVCTPTLTSKADLKPEDLCLVDLEGNQLVGSRPRTSEILLHLEIYKAVPEAKAAVHCHPPHATAYAITGSVPPNCLIPEYEVFVGSVALSPYETPGTQKFAETVIPYVRQHNAILLGNHGIICWADTVTHAEWYAEVLETYCWTVMIASQLGAPLTRIPPDKAADLLEIKKRLGLPDRRYELKECGLCDLPETHGGIALPPPRPSGGGMDTKEIDSIVQAVTDTVMAALQRGGGAKK